MSVSVRFIFIILNRVNWVKTAGKEGKSRWMKFELGNFLSRVEKQNQFKLYEKNKLFPFSNEDHHHHNAEFLTFSNGISAVNQKYICHLISHFPFRQWNSFSAPIFFSFAIVSLIEQIVSIKTIYALFYALSSIYYYSFLQRKAAAHEKWESLAEIMEK